MDESELTHLENLKDHLGPSVKNYPRDGWWVIATANEVGEKPLARTLLQKRVVLFRASDGKPYALLDRCPPSVGTALDGQGVTRRNRLSISWISIQRER